METKNVESVIFPKISALSASLKKENYLIALAQKDILTTRSITNAKVCP